MSDEAVNPNQAVNPSQPVNPDRTVDRDGPPRREAAGPEDELTREDEYADLDPDTITEDAIEYFGDEPGEADSPASDADAPPPG